MFYGKIKDSNEFYFDIFADSFESCVEVSDEQHLYLMHKVNDNGKQIVPDESGHPILIDRPPESEKELARKEAVERLAYLRDTDWYVLRYIEEGKAVPDSIKLKRHEAREKLSSLREKYKLDFN